MADFKILRMDEGMTAHFEGFLRDRLPDYNTADTIEIQVTTTVYDHGDGGPMVKRYFIVDENSEEV